MNNTITPAAAAQPDDVAESSVASPSTTRCAVERTLANLPSAPPTVYGPLFDRVRVTMLARRLGIPAEDLDIYLAGVTFPASLSTIRIALARHGWTTERMYSTLGASP